VQFKFFTDNCLHLNELSLKLQGAVKFLDFMFHLIKGFEVKLNLFICYIENRKLKYFKYLK